MRSYNNFRYGDVAGDGRRRSFIDRSERRMYDDDLANRLNLMANIPPSIVVDYFPNLPFDLTQFEDLIGRHNYWCFYDLYRSEIENLTLELMADFELNMQLCLLLQEEADSICSVMESLRRMEIGDAVAGKRQAVVRRAEEVVDRVKLPKSISVRCHGLIKGAKGGDWSTGRIRVRKRVRGRVRAVGRVGTKSSNNTQKVYVHGTDRDTPVELTVYKQGLAKTELCNKWQKNGYCPYSDRCKFAHGLEELRPILRHPLYKTKVCRMIPCTRRVHRCHFLHSLNDKEEDVVTKKLSLIFQLV